MNLLKLCVGTDSVEDLAAWQAVHAPGNPSGLPRHVTRMWPKRADEVLNGGSLYWVFKGVVLARQRIVRLDEVRREDGIPRCGIVLDPHLVRTEAMPKRPFQGWRYLAPEAAPRDLPQRRASDDRLPPRLEAALAEIGVR